MMSENRALMQALSENPDEMHRYEAYRRSRINPSTIRKVQGPCLSWPWNEIMSLNSCTDYAKSPWADGY